MEAKSSSAMQRALSQAGYLVERCEGNWAVASRNGQREAIYRQSSNRWHFFWEGIAASESAHGPGDRRGGLGDVLDSDLQVRVYVRALRNVPKWADISPALVIEGGAP